MPLIFFLIALILGAFLTRVFLPIAKKIGIHDEPGEKRKIHERPVPLLGGVPLLLSFFAACLIWIFWSNFTSASALSIHQYTFGKNIDASQMIHIFIGFLILFVGGLLDDKYKLSPGKQIIFPILAIFIVIAGGIGIKQITNPLGGIINLSVEDFNFAGFKIFWPGTLITFFWLLGMSYTTKILDGLDGLASGISALGASIIAILSLFTKWYQPDVAVLALIFAGSVAGFLFFNFYPAKIFLGEGGSLMLGFFVGVLAIISGSKIITTLLVIGLPALDVLWAIFRRLRSGYPVTRGDGGHIHHLLINAGFTHRGAVLFMYLIAMLFGFAGVFLGSGYKVIMLGLIFFFVFALLAILGGFRDLKPQKTGGADKHLTKL